MERYELLRDLPIEKRGAIWTIVGDTIQSEVTGNSFLLKDLHNFSYWFDSFDDNWTPEANDIYYYIDILYNNYQSGFFVREKFYRQDINTCKMDVEQNNYFKSENKALILVDKIHYILMPFRNYFDVKNREYYYSIQRKNGVFRVGRFMYVVGYTGKYMYKREIEGEIQYANCLHKKRKDDGNFFSDIKVAKNVLEEINKLFKNKENEES